MARINPTPPEDLVELRERQEAQARFMRELDRLIPANGWSGKADCKICGAEVRHRLKHFEWHTRDLMRETLTALFVNQEGVDR